MTTKLPIPTLSNPFAQVNYIFNLVAETKNTISSQSNYITALKHYKNYLLKTNDYNVHLKETKLFYIDKHWNPTSLVNFYNYLQKNKEQNYKEYLSVHSIVSIISAVRNVMNEAIINGYTSFDNLINVSIRSAKRETDSNTAYTPKELNQIEKILNKELDFVYKVYRKEGYIPQNIGENPKDSKTGWGAIDNMRWYFENVLKLEPILGDGENQDLHRSFVVYAPRKYYQSLGGLRGIYKIWGIAPIIDKDLLMPLVLKLTKITGLNSESVLNLQIDCFEEINPISGVPVLKYFKRRSGGDKELHINIHNALTKEYRNEEVKEIKKIINIILSLTDDIRKRAPDKCVNYLFIVENNSRKKFKEIDKLSKKMSAAWCRKIVDKYKLENDDGDKMTLNLQKFRSTKATELVDKGVDAFELQYEMGHRSIDTTMNYIAKNQLDNKAQKSINEAIAKIFDNSCKSNDKFLTEANGNPIFKGIISDCKNPFDPPEDVKKLSSYQKGTVCSRVNMCLFCNNVMVFKRNLPTLWMYKKQIEGALDGQLSELPNQNYYLMTLQIIEGLFDKKTSEFHDEDIEEAIKIAENLDELVDPVTYRDALE